MFGDAISALFSKKKEQATDLLEHPGLTGSRFLVIAGFAGLLLWVTKGVLTEANIRMLFWGVLVYVGCNTITRSIQLICNTTLRKTTLRLAYADGTLDPAEVGIVTAQADEK